MDACWAIGASGCHERRFGTGDEVTGWRKWLWLRHMRRVGKQHPIDWELVERSWHNEMVNQQLRAYEHLPPQPPGPGVESSPEEAPGDEAPYAPGDC